MSSDLGRILVTGGAGFVGTRLVEKLVSEGRSVRVLEKPGASLAHLPTGRIETVYADLRDEAAVKEAAVDCDVVLHLAANPNLWSRDPTEFEEVNHLGTRRVLAAARAHGARRVVHVSTESILAPPGLEGLITEETVTTLDDMIGPYCRSKWLAEQAAREAAAAGDPVIIVRPSIPIGAGDRLMGPLTRTLRDFCNGKIKAYLEGDLNLIDVGDVAEGIWAAAERGELGRPYLLVHENWTVLEFFRYAAEVVSLSTPRWRVPYPVALLFAHLEEQVRQCLPLKGTAMATVTGVKLTQRSMHFDGHASARNLGLSPMRPCREAISEAIDDLRAAGQIRGG